VLCAELPDRRRGDVHMCPDPRRRSSGADPRQLLDEDGLVQVVAALPPVLEGVLEPEQALGGELSEHLVGEPVVLLPLLGVGRQLAFYEAAGGGPQLLVLLGEGWGGRQSGGVPVRAVGVAALSARRSCPSL